MGKGTVVQPTLWGNLLLGPTARELHQEGTAQENSDGMIEKL
jgi:L-2-hydroxyglutarate oxidase LhgO